jgi:hypothetical protein
VSERGSGRAWSGAATMTMVNATTSAGYSLVGLLSVPMPSNESARIFALYAAARSVPLALAVFWLVAVRSVRALGTLAAVLAGVQACDSVVGLIQHDPGKTIGPAVFAVATAVAARFLLRAPTATARTAN